MGPIVTRAEAKRLGLKRYCTGEPCPEGHLSERYTSEATCCECRAIQRREWRAANRDRDNECARTAYYANLEHSRATNRKRKKKNYAASRERGTQRKWIEANRDRWRIYNIDVQSRRRSLLKDGGSFTKDDIDRIFKAQKEQCAYCRADLNSGFQIDHIMPLAKGGSNYPKNLQLCCADCNRSKHAKDPIEFAQSRGLLL